MRFVFRFQAVLNWKKTLEELSQVRFSEKTRRLLNHEEDIQRMISLRRSAGRSLQDMIREAVSASEFVTHKEYEEACYREIRSKEEEKERLVREVESEKKELVGFMMERKMLERLREKEARRFDSHAEKMEQKQIDEETLIRRRGDER